ncbi:MAG: hypothetical protein PVG82_08325 [Chromatiales bacterium]
MIVLASKLRFVIVLLCALVPFAELQGSCAPQCVAHARLESGIYTNRVGATGGAVDWFEQASQAGDTRVDPGVGLVGLPLVLGEQPGINPTYGHVIYVEHSRELVDDQAYELLVSHANFDGRCSIEGARARYFPATRRLEFLDGYFAGRTFTARGFITR